jgi:hypothetical protein
MKQGTILLDRKDGMRMVLAVDRRGVTVSVLNSFKQRGGTYSPDQIERLGWK